MGQEQAAPTRWVKVTRIAWVFVISYILLVLAQLVFDCKWPDWLRDILNAGFSVALLVISIQYGGILTDFYSKLTGFGISEVRVNRRGQDPTLTKLWMDRISGSKEITIVGTLSQGWFIVAHDNLNRLLNTTKYPERLYICLLDPFGNVWRSKIESGQSIHDKFVEDVIAVFRNVNKLAVAHQEKVIVQLYDTEPISCVVARGAIYFAPYLPRTTREESPEFTISTGSFLGDKVYSESVQKLKQSAPTVMPEILEEYIKIMKKHSTTTREAFWNDREVYCDFCKEPRGFPSEISRRYPAFIDGSRIAAKKDHFFIVPSLGQLVPDHALIVSSEHVTSSGQLGEKAREELDGLLNKVQMKTAAEGKSHLFFEHGIPFEGTAHGGCGICHCHVHSLPIEKTEYNPIDEIEKYLKEKHHRFERQKLDSWRNIQKWHNRSYLCVKAGSHTPVVFVFDVDQRVESQLMRQFLVENCPNSRKGWNWREANDEQPTLKESRDRLRETYA